jgi:pilus assembly protein FimV
MSNGKNPLMLMMALSMPGAAQALGLGDIHVDSGLNERLAAEIDIVGATALDLIDLRAAVANRDTFLRYGADRPAFLSSATFKVTQDSQGRPVLAVRSSESFTEPVVNFLVDLHWSHGELVRQYTLLLDPAGFASVPPANVAPNVPAAPGIPAVPNVPAAPPVATPIVESKTQTVARQADPPTDQSDAGAEPAVRKTTHIKVGAKATLRGVAWRVGERSESDLQRMMIAIFRANPSAFDGNINRLHRGAVLTIPSHAEAAAIPKIDAKREVHAQMTAWRASARAVAASGAMASTPAPATPAPATSVSAASVPMATVAGAAPNTADSSSADAKAANVAGTEALGRRVQSLEQTLSEMKGVLENERVQLLDLRQQAARADKTVPVAGPQVGGAPQAVNVPQAVIAAPHAQPKRGYTALIPVVAGLGLLSAALAAIYVKFRRRAMPSKAPRNDGVTAVGPAPVDAAAADVVSADGLDGLSDAALHGGSPGPGQALAQERSRDVVQPCASGDTGADAGASAAADDSDSTHPMLPALSAGQAGRSEIAAGASSRAVQQDPTVNLHVETVNLRMDPTRLDYNFLDLDLTAQHVHLPSVLNEQPVVKERRTNLADVLKMAIEREPDRHDLRMKLLELYYSAAATNRKAFLEVVQKFARDRDYLQPEQWDKVAYMGRQIASDNPMFTEESAADDDLANCA